MLKGLYGWLELIEKRPGMYLREPGFASLESFIAGYDTALIDHQVLEDEQPPFSGFGAFAAARLGRAGERTTAGLPGGKLDIGPIHWSTAIRDAAPDDREAFDLFFKLLRDYRAHSVQKDAPR